MGNERSIYYKVYAYISLLVLLQSFIDLGHFHIIPMIESIRNNHPGIITHF